MCCNGSVAEVINEADTYGALPHDAPAAASADAAAAR